jgi:hypothetical protein
MPSHEHPEHVLLLLCGCLPVQLQLLWQRWWTRQIPQGLFLLLLLMPQRQPSQELLVIISRVYCCADWLRQWILLLLLLLLRRRRNLAWSVIA